MGHHLWQSRTHCVGHLNPNNSGFFHAQTLHGTAIYMLTKLTPKTTTPGRNSDWQSGLAVPDSSRRGFPVPTLEATVRTGSVPYSSVHRNGNTGPRVRGSYQRPRILSGCKRPGFYYVLLARTGLVGDPFPTEIYTYKSPFFFLLLGLWLLTVPHCASMSR